MKGVKKVLIADDDSRVRSLVSRMLSPEMKVIEASDGQQAVDAANDQMPDLILLDILMPHRDGYSACMAIKSNPKTRSIPTIMLSGIGYGMNVELSRQVGANDYMGKPFTVEDLKNTIHKYI